MNTQEPIYLDHNATTPVHPAVVEAMLPYLHKHFGNPSSGHVYGQRAKEAVGTDFGGQSPELSRPTPKSSHATLLPGTVGLIPAGGGALQLASG